jgi:MFS family permease
MLRYFVFPRTKEIPPNIFFFSMRIDAASDWCFDIWVCDTLVASSYNYSDIMFHCSALADKYGRRWPLMIDIVLFSLINMASGFAPNLQTFIALRALFGIAMGGEWVKQTRNTQYKKPNFFFFFFLYRD